MLKLKKFTQNFLAKIYESNIFTIQSYKFLVIFGVSEFLIFQHLEKYVAVKEFYQN